MSSHYSSYTPKATSLHVLTCDGHKALRQALERNESHADCLLAIYSYYAHSFLYSCVRKS